jgi:hypothetical protein
MPRDEKKSLRWSSTSQAAKLLRSGLENGDIDPSLAPNILHKCNPIFQKYDLTRFRAGLNKIKANLGMHVRKPLDTDGVDEEEEEDSNSGLGGGIGKGNSTSNMVKENVVSTQEWMPINHIFEWKDSLRHDRITVIVLMPTGVGKHYTLAVKDDGYVLEIITKWPQMFCNDIKLHEGFAQVIDMKNAGTSALSAETKDHFLKVQGFQQRIDELRNTKEKPFQSKTRIRLPKQVNCYAIEPSHIGSAVCGSRILYVNLLGERSNSGAQEGKDCYMVDP